jgi:hypothetical protein
LSISNVIMAKSSNQGVMKILLLAAE